MKIIRLSVMAALAISACTSYHGKSAVALPSGTESDNIGFDWYGDSVSKLVRLDQGWTVADSNWFYRTTQGSQLLPYAFFLALERPNERTLFRDGHNMLKYRFLPERPSKANPDGLPVGLVADPDSTLPQGLSLIGAR